MKIGVILTDTCDLGGWDEIFTSVGRFYRDLF